MEHIPLRQHLSKRDQRLLSQVLLFLPLFPYHITKQTEYQWVSQGKKYLFYARKTEWITKVISPNNTPLLSLKRELVSLWWADKSMNSFAETIIISRKEMITALQKKGKKSIQGTESHVGCAWLWPRAPQWLLGSLGTLALSSINNSKNCILWLHWYKGKHNLVWVHYYIFTTINSCLFVLLLKEIKTFSSAMKSITDLRHWV